MTPISTEDDYPAGEYSAGEYHEQPAGRPFRRAMAITITALGILCLVFVALGYFQGPKLSSAQVDTARVVEQPNQQLRLFANQAVASVKAKQVTVTPATAFTASSEGEVIAIQFTNRLSYGTRYQVSINGVTSAYQQQNVAFHYSFETSPASVFYLQRANPATGGNDSIIETTVSGAEHTVVYSAPHIQEFASFPEALAVVTINDDKTSSLSIVTLKGQGVENLVLPDQGSIVKLQSSPEAGLLGFVFSSGTGPSGQQVGQYLNTLMTVDLNGAQTVQPVLGLNSQPLSVLDWQFLPGTANIVAQTSDETVLLVNSTKPTQSVPVGQYPTFDRASLDGTTLVVGDVTGMSGYVISSGKQIRLNPIPIAGEAPFGGDLQLVGKAGDRVQQIAVFDAQTGRFASYIVYDSGGKSRVLFQSPDGKGSINGFSVSPNGQYVAVEEVPDIATSVSDDYFRNPQSTTVTTVFVDIATGAVVKSVDGSGLDW